MGRMDAGLGVNSDDPDDIEVGCVCWSKTHFRGEFPRGGTVVRLNIDADDERLTGVVVLEQNVPGRLDTFEMDPADVDMETVAWHGKNARLAAEIVNRWLGSKSGPRDTSRRLWWQRAALELAEAGQGLWLPGADRRARRADAARQAEREAS